MASSVEGPPLLALFQLLCLIARPTTDWLEAVQLLPLAGEIADRGAQPTENPRGGSCPASRDVHWSRAGGGMGKICECGFAWRTRNRVPAGAHICFRPPIGRPDPRRPALFRR